MNGCYVIRALAFQCLPPVRMLDQAIEEPHRLRCSPRVDVNHVHEGQIIRQDGVVVQ